MTFLIIPAVDILGGKCVRLEKGDYNKVTVFAEDPVAQAHEFEEQGYHMIHIVDLDGAKQGIPVNIGVIKKIASSVHIPIEVGGGIRTLDTIRELFESGVTRVILGTVAFENLGFIKTACELYGDKLAVSMDAKKDLIVTKGWIEKTDIKPIEAAKRLIDLGIRRFVYTDISKDGMMKGPNYSGIKKFASAISVPVIASGGVTTNEDVEKLSKIKNVEGCIVGRAVYEGKVGLK